MGDFNKNIHFVFDFDGNISVSVLDSAKKHGLSEEEILYAYQNVIRSRTVERSGNINATVEYALCLLKNGNPCELMAALSYDEKSILIFHAMTPPSKGFIRTLDKGY